jgi:hypothetical protein
MHRPEALFSAPSKTGAFVACVSDSVFTQNAILYMVTRIARLSSSIVVCSANAFAKSRGENVEFRRPSLLGAVSVCVDNLVAAGSSCQANDRENRMGDKEEERRKGTRGVTGTRSWLIKTVAVFSFLWHV